MLRVCPFGQVAAEPGRIDLAARLRDPVLGLLGRRLRLVALLETGAIADWEADALAYRAAAEALRHPLYLWYVPLWRGMRALAAGRPDECRAALAEAAAIGERAASGNAIMLVQTQRWCLRAEERDTPALLVMLDQLETVSVPAPSASRKPRRGTGPRRSRAPARWARWRWPRASRGRPRPLRFHEPTMRSTGTGRCGRWRTADAISGSGTALNETMGVIGKNLEAARAGGA